MHRRVKRATRSNILYHRWAYRPFYDDDPMFAFIKQNFRWLAGGFMLTYFSSFGQTYFISASVAEWQAAFDLTHGEFGRLYMLATLASAMCLPFLGRIVDLVPAHMVIVIIVPVLAVASLLAGFAASVPVLFAAIFMLRLFGQGMMTHTALTTTGRWFVAERGRAMSLVVMGHQGGEATIPLMFAALAVAFGYKIGWFAAALALLFVGLPFAFWCYYKPRVPHGKASTETSKRPQVRDWTRAEVLRDPVFWVLLTGVLAPPFIGTTIFYHQNYMTELNDWPPQLFATSLLVMAMTTIVVALISGAAIDRFGAIRILPVFLLPLASSCFALAQSGPEASLFVVMTLLGISYGFSMTLFGSLWPEVYGLANLGAIRSITVSAAVVATAAGPGLTGTLIDQGISLPAQMTFFGIYCLLAAVSLALASFAVRRRAA